MTDNATPEPIGGACGTADELTGSTGNANGGTGMGDTVGGLVGVTAGTITVSYGFGAISNEGTLGSDGNTMLLPTSVTVNNLMLAGTAWSLDTWDFGSTSQPPALKYVDEYSSSVYTCTSTTAFLPAITIVCSTALLPGQGR